MKLEELAGKRVRAEYRIGRRTHRVGVGTLRIRSRAVEAVFPCYSDGADGEFVFPLNERCLARLIPVQQRDCDYQFSGVLDREESVSEDDGAWTKPPKIVTLDD